jgi:hypothetical protein
MNREETGLNDLNKDGSQIVTVYPNPAKTNISANITLLRSQEVTIDLYDTQGKTVKSVSKGILSQGKSNFDISLTDVSEGIYFLKVNTEDASVGKKIVVIK